MSGGSSGESCPVTGPLKGRRRRSFTELDENWLGAQTETLFLLFVLPPVGGSGISVRFRPFESRE